MAEKENNRFTSTWNTLIGTTHSVAVNVGPTRLVDSTKRVSGVVFAGLEAVLTEVKIVTGFALESWAVNRKHLTAITPVSSKTFYSLITQTVCSKVTLMMSLIEQDWFRHIQITELVQSLCKIISSKTNDKVNEWPLWWESFYLVPQHTDQEA